MPIINSFRPPVFHAHEAKPNGGAINTPPPTTNTQHSPVPQTGLAVVRRSTPLAQAIHANPHAISLLQKSVVKHNAQQRQLTGPTQTTPQKAGWLSQITQTLGLGVEENSLAGIISNKTTREFFDSKATLHLDHLLKNCEDLSIREQIMTLASALEKYVLAKVRANELGHSLAQTQLQFMELRILKMAHELGCMVSFSKATPCVSRAQDKAGIISRTLTPDTIIENVLKEGINSNKADDHFTAFHIMIEGLCHQGQYEKCAQLLFEFQGSREDKIHFYYALIENIFPFLSRDDMFQIFRHISGDDLATLAPLMLQTVSIDQKQFDLRTIRLVQSLVTENQAQDSALYSAQQLKIILKSLSPRTANDFICSAIICTKEKDSWQFSNLYEMMPMKDPKWFQTVREIIEHKSLFIKDVPPAEMKQTKRLKIYDSIQKVFEAQAEYAKKGKDSHIAVKNRFNNSFKTFTEFYNSLHAEQKQMALQIYLSHLQHIKDEKHLWNDEEIYEINAKLLLHFIKHVNMTPEIQIFCNNFDYWGFESGKFPQNIDHNIKGHVYLFWDIRKLQRSNKTTVFEPTKGYISLKNYHFGPTFLNNVDMRHVQCGQIHYSPDYFSPPSPIAIVTRNGNTKKITNGIETPLAPPRYKADFSSDCTVSPHAELKNTIIDHNTFLWLIANGCRDFSQAILLPDVKIPENIKDLKLPSHPLQRPNIDYTNVSPEIFNQLKLLYENYTYISYHLENRSSVSLDSNYRDMNKILDLYQKRDENDKMFFLQCLFVILSEIKAHKHHWSTQNHAHINKALFEFFVKSIDDDSRDRLEAYFSNYAFFGLESGTLPDEFYKSELLKPESLNNFLIDRGKMILSKKYPIYLTSNYFRGKSIQTHLGEVRISRYADLTNTHIKTQQALDWLIANGIKNFSNAILAPGLKMPEDTTEYFFPEDEKLVLNDFNDKYLWIKPRR